jgi:hypothetical protein
MAKFVRVFLILFILAQIFAAVALFLQLPIITNLWPFEGTTPLTYIFVSSILAAAAAATLWVVVSGHFGALAGIALNYMTIMTPTSIIAFRSASVNGEPSMLLLGIITAASAFAGLLMFLWSIRIPLDRSAHTPGLVRWSFVVFVVGLLIVGARAILKVRNAVPWTITPELSVLIGCMFLGASAYFAYGVLRPGWLNSVGQLIGFLAYDLVLIVPFLTRLATTPPERMPGLIVYTVVVLYSGIIAIIYLVPLRQRRASTVTPSIN